MEYLSDERERSLEGIVQRIFIDNRTMTTTGHDSYIVDLNLDYFFTQDSKMRELLTFIYVSSRRCFLLGEERVI